MLGVNSYSKHGLVTLVITAISFFLTIESAIAGEDKEQVLKIDCSKGQDVQEALDAHLTGKLPLILVIKGTCADDEGDIYEVEVKRDNVSFRGDEVEGGYITGAVIVEGARDIEIAENMELDILSVERGVVFLEVEEEYGEIKINGPVGLLDQAALHVVTDANESSIHVGNVGINNHSLLLVQQPSNITIGSVEIGDISASLQSSLKVSYATIGNIDISQDSHAFFAQPDIELNVFPAGGSATFVCDSESKIWGPISPGFYPLFQSLEYCAGF